MDNSSKHAQCRDLVVFGSQVRVLPGHLSDSLSNLPEAVERLVATLGALGGLENLQVSGNVHEAIVAQSGAVDPALVRLEAKENRKLSPTDRRKLYLSHTIVVSQIAGFELQQFRDTGLLTVTVPQELFDRDFPGHYLRLIKRVKVSLIALLPPALGLRATLSASGVSRTVVARGSFDTVTLRREPEAIAFTAPVGASGLFDLEPEGGMLLPFEGMGVDTVWQLSMPKAANPFDYRTIADVLLTIEYTALDSPEYRQKVIRSLDRTFSGDRSFSLRNQSPTSGYSTS